MYRCRAVKSMFFFTLGCKPHNPNRVGKNLTDPVGSEVMQFLCVALGSRLLASEGKREVRRAAAATGAQRGNPAGEIIITVLKRFHPMSIHVSYHMHFCQVKTGVGFEGYEPNYRPLCCAMEPLRSRPTPTRTSGDSKTLVNPFHSAKVQGEYLLQAARPPDLPDVSGMEEHQVQNTSCLAPPRSLMPDAPTGKGRGCQSAGARPMATEPTVTGAGKHAD